VQVHPHVYVSAQVPAHYADSGMSLIPIARVRPIGLTADDKIVQLAGVVAQLTQGTPSAVIGFSSSAGGGAACDVAPAAPALEPAFELGDS
jgi:hypothetical protein